MPTEAILPDEGIIKGRDVYPASVVCHKLLSVCNAFIYILWKEKIQMMWYIVSPPTSLQHYPRLDICLSMNQWKPFNSHILCFKCNLWVNKMKHFHSESTTLIHSFVLGKSKKVTEEHLTNLAMDDHSGSLVPHFLHCYVRCDVWDNDSCRNPELAGRISCCHAGITSYWNKQTNKKLDTLNPSIW